MFWGVFCSSSSRVGVDLGSVWLLFIICCLVISFFLLMRMLILLSR